MQDRRLHDIATNIEEKESASDEVVHGILSSPWHPIEEYVLEMEIGWLEAVLDSTLLAAVRDSLRMHCLSIPLT